MSTDLLFGQLQTSSPELLFGDGGGSVPVAPSATDLIFERPASTSTPNLVFGGDGETVAPDVSVTLTATLPPLTASIVITPRVLVQVAAALPPMTCTATALYKSEAQRPTVADVGGVWQVATPTAALSTPQHQNTAPLPTGIQGAYQEAQPTATHIAHHLPDVLMPSDAPHVARHQDAAPLGHQAAIWQQHGIPTVARTAARHQDAHGLRYSARTQSQDGIRRATQRCTHWQTGQRQTAWRKARHQVADPLHIKRTTKNKDGMPPPPGISLIPSPPAPQPCYTPNPHLLFAEIAALNGHLVFVCGQTPAPPPMPEGGTVIPIRKAYIVIHNATLTRVSDSAPIHASRMTIALDADSWAWRFTATLLGRDALALVEPSPLGEPVVVAAHVNGHTWHVIVDSWTDNRQFGQVGISISGRGLTSDLAQPYQLQTSGVTSSDMTMQQVLNAHLPFGEGWGITWAAGTPDWLVPTGAWSWSNQSPMQAIFDAAQSVGLIVVPAKASKAMTVMPRYPVLPWEFDSATPALTVPDAAILSLSRAQAIPTQANAVYVHGGETGGVIGQVKRALSAGDRVAPTQSSPLITHTDAARLLGGRILASQHQQPDVRSVTMPMGGVFTLGEIGQLLHVNLGSSYARGIINSVQLDVSMSDREMTVRQTLTIGEDTPNSWARFKRLMPDAPMLLGEIVQVYSDGTAYVDMLGGGSVRARGTGTVGQNVYVKNGQIEGAAPTLPSTLIEV